MSEFQKNLQSSSIPATSPRSNIPAQFAIFRSFVLSALQGLQLQLRLLTAKSDELEMRSRRKILLEHGLQDNKKDNDTFSVVKMNFEHLKIPDIISKNISGFHRIEKPVAGRPRDILVKFHDLVLRNKVWFAKTNLKNSGITLSEFLIKERYDMFVAARLRFEITKCWARSGCIVVVGADGSKKRITIMAELNNLSSSFIEVPSPNVAATTSAGSYAAKQNKVTNVRPKYIP